MVGLLWVACAARPAHSASSDLAGLNLPLVPGGAFRVTGSLQGQPAEVVLDTASPLTLVSPGCKSSGGSRGEISVPAPGGQRKYASGELSALQLGDRTLRGGTVGRAGPSDRCVVALGLDQLSGYSLRWNAQGITFQPKGTPLPQGEGWSSAPITRNPTGDWALVVARAAREGRWVPGPFVLSLGEAHSRWSYPPATVGMELLSGWILANVQLEQMKGKPSDALLGILGADVWRRFEGVLDWEKRKLSLRPLEKLSPAETVLQRRASPGLEGEPSEPKEP